MDFHGAGADVEFARDCLVALPLGQTVEHFAFAQREPSDPLPRFGRTGTLRTIGIGLAAGPGNGFVQGANLCRQRKVIEGACLDRPDHGGGLRRIGDGDDRQPVAGLHHPTDQTRNPLAHGVVLRQHETAGRRMRQKLFGIGIDLGMVARGKGETSQLCPAGGVLIKDVECDTINHAVH